MKPNKNISSQIKSCIDFVQKICIIHGKVKAPVAQLDRASPSEGGDCAFESRRVRQKFNRRMAV